jgi:mRNA interferase RelE/StbE
MSWRVQYTRTFLKEMSRLPAHIRQRAEEIAFGEEVKQDPFKTGKVQKLSGYSSFYKIRIGDYRIGLYVNADGRIVEFQRALHRREIYRKFP